ncbi:hypothetical protein GCM10023333_41010 [Ferrimonas pelagia]|uniref:Transglycosylase SLT domain-containing protein n=1 Tax=Ferrimonas pelagia TaxID=1177826 RepID=A0ABP9FHU4_9GAMM
MGAGCLVLAAAGSQLRNNESAPQRQALELPPFTASSITIEQDVREYAQRLETAYQLSPEKAYTYSNYILESAEYSDVPKELLAALIHTESHFRDDVISVVGAVGPAQIMPQLWNAACGDVHEPRTNILCAGVVLQHYKRRFCADDSAPYACALSNYNVGPGNLRRRPDSSLAAANRYLNKMSNALAVYDEVMVDLSMEREPIILADVW